MRVRSIFVFLCALATLAQSPPSKYQVGTITEVRAHQAAQTDPNGTQSSPAQYDVSIRVGNTIYVVLYTPADRTNSVEYHVGLDLPVLVADKTITFSNMLGDSVEVPILRHQAVQAQPSR